MGNPAAPYQWANATEAFAFVNFTGAAGTSWDTIVLDDTYGKGFETDNWTSRVNGWNPSKDASLPGTVIADLTTQGGNTTVAAVTSATLNPSGQLVLQNGGKFVSNFVPSAPGAPAPPMAACLAFAGVLLFQALRRRSVA
jgi:hypothetical protein